jgi:catechol 2,3-dioxygenase-like lactoylglutathione lyase family enzyme
MRGHLSLRVQDVPRSVEFYRRVFGVGPQKQTGRYAKFDLVEPPLNFALVQGAESSRVGHLGIEAASAAEFAALRERLAAAGVGVQPETGSRCCYALQDKLWFSDPDGNAWEVFLVHEQLPVPDEDDEAAAAGPACGPGASAGGPSVAGAGRSAGACCG